MRRCGSLVGSISQIASAFFVYFCVFFVANLLHAHRAGTFFTQFAIVAFACIAAPDLVFYLTARVSRAFFFLKGVN